ncbi:MAG TPA: dihydroneopterin aldolase [Methylophilaceae bacterium]|nr:dihydroneopterin aldolase [Methylophilaceae bacterium]
MDTIFISEIKAEVKLGVPDWERLLPQTVLLDIEIEMPHSRSCETDDIQDTIDYGQVVVQIRQSLVEKNFRLVEALAEHVCQLILANHDTPRVKVKVGKPGILLGVKQLGVIIERHRAG